MDDERIRRPELERSEPVRDWSKLFPQAGSNGSPAGPEQAVAMGYRVIEDYIRRGAEAARDMSAGPGSPADPGASSLLFERLLQSASDLGGIWLEMLQALWSTQANGAPARSDPGGFEVRDTPTPPPTPQASAPAPAPAKSHGSNVAFRVHGTCARAVELSATLDVDPASSLLVHDLRALDASLPRIQNVRFELQLEQARGLIVLEIPADQPSGMYAGLIVDAQSNLPRGTVSVRVL